MTYTPVFHDDPADSDDPFRRKLAALDGLLCVRTPSAVQALRAIADRSDGMLRAETLRRVQRAANAIR